MSAVAVPIVIGVITLPLIGRGFDVLSWTEVAICYAAVIVLPLSTVAFAWVLEQHYESYRHYPPQRRRR